MAEAGGYLIIDNKVVFLGLPDSAGVHWSPQFNARLKTIELKHQEEALCLIFYITQYEEITAMIDQLT